MHPADSQEGASGLGHGDAARAAEEASAAEPAPAPLDVAPAVPPDVVVVSARSGNAARAADVRALVAEGVAAKDPQRQLELFRRAHERDLNDALAMSYHGMAIATVQHRYQQGIVFCEEAVRRTGPSPDLLVNLAHAYLAAKNKKEAVRALRRALNRASGEDERVRAELAHLGLRRSPPIPFLPRAFFLNKLVGRLRHWLTYRKQLADDGRSPIPAERGELSGDVAAAQKQLSDGSPPPGGTP